MPIRCGRTDKEFCIWSACEILGRADDPDEYVDKWIDNFFGSKLHAVLAISGSVTYIPMDDDPAGFIGLGEVRKLEPEPVQPTTLTGSVTLRTLAGGEKIRVWDNEQMAGDPLVLPATLTVTAEWISQILSSWPVIGWLITARNDDTPWHQHMDPRDPRSLRLGLVFCSG